MEDIRNIIIGDEMSLDNFSPLVEPQSATVSMAPPQGVLAPEGYHEPSLQKKDLDASSHLRQMMCLDPKGGEDGLGS